MNPNVQRGQFLLEQKRFDLAEKELRAALVQDPHNPVAHALLALALSAQQKKKDALAAAYQAIQAAPDYPFGHYVLAAVLDDQDRLREAEAAVGHAITLDPENAASHALKGSILLQQSRWRDALAAAEAGLQHDSENVGCLNVRGVALQRLGRRAEAGQVLDSALAREPENARTHAHRGWSALEAGDQTRALDHFREALRLEPGMDWAREGVVTALKSRNVVYRLLLGFFFWTMRLPTRARWGVILGGYFLSRTLDQVADANPALRPVLVPLLIAYYVFIFLTWTADPLFNLLLRLRPLGRVALTRQQIAASNAVALCLLAALTFLGAWLAVRVEAALVGAGVCAAMTLPVASSLRKKPGPVRNGLVAYTIALGLVGAAAIQRAFVDPDLNGAWPLGFFLLGWIAFTWIGAGLSASGKR
jgi:tetratricopeptide (TPR) repeat protein